MNEEELEIHGKRHRVWGGDMTPTPSECCKCNRERGTVPVSCDCPCHTPAPVEKESQFEREVTDITSAALANGFSEDEVAAIAKKHKIALEFAPSQSVGWESELAEWLKYNKVSPSGVAALQHFCRSLLTQKEQETIGEETARNKEWFDRGQKQKEQEVLERVGMLRQWLNEDRKCEPMVTNEDILHWLDLRDRITKSK